MELCVVYAPIQMNIKFEGLRCRIRSFTKDLL